MLRSLQDELNNKSDRVWTRRTWLGHWCRQKGIGQSPRGVEEESRDDCVGVHVVSHANLAAVLLLLLLTLLGRFSEQLKPLIS